MIGIKQKKKKNALEAKLSSQIRQRSQTTSVSPGLSRGLCHLCWESLLCLYLPKLEFSSTILLFFVYPLITSNRGLEAQAQERRMVEENLERVLWLHIRTGVVPGKLPSKHDSLCSWKEGENQNQDSGPWWNYTQKWFCSYLTIFWLYLFGAVPECSCAMLNGRWWWQAWWVFYWEVVVRAGQVNFTSPF